MDSKEKTLLQLTSILIVKLIRLFPVKPSSYRCLGSPTTRPNGQDRRQRISISCSAIEKETEGRRSKQATGASARRLGCSPFEGRDSSVRRSGVRRSEVGTRVFGCSGVLVLDLGFRKEEAKEDSGLKSVLRSGPGSSGIQAVDRELDRLSSVPNTMILSRVSLFLAFLFVTSWASNEEQNYIIHMEKNRIRDSISELSFHEEEPEFERNKILYVYETVISGFAAKLSGEQLRFLSKVPGFLSATPDEMLDLHTTHTPKFLGLQTGRGLWNSKNLASDVIIGVLDTGIWPEHISFQDKGMSEVPSKWRGICENGTKFSSSNCNRKLIGARALYKGYESIVGKINETSNYRSARDSDGHGTHTASTAAGNRVQKTSFYGLAKGTASGMSYTSRIAAYKVCWPFGCASSDILAAMDRAVLDGVDVLSLSLGGPSRPYYIDSIAIASFGATQKGVFVSCSAGNSGPFSSTVGNIAPWIMTVAASYIDRTFPTTVKLGNGQTFRGSSLYTGKNTKNLPLVFNTSAGGQGAEYCLSGSLTPKLVKGKIVVCLRGLNGRTEKGEQVKLAGGAGMLLLNNQGEGEELFADPHILPATSLGASAAMAIRAYVTSKNNSKASIKFKGTAYGNRAPMVAAFSSRGPSLIGGDVIKPDLTAPGVNILAAWPPKPSPSLLESDKRSVLFNIISGTSMSCPHVSGIAALLKSMHKDWSPAAIKSALMTTAYTLDNKNLPIQDVSSSNLRPASPFAFGSGHVQPERASDPGLVYDITPNDYLEYLCSLNYTTRQISIVSRTNFNCSKQESLQPGDLNYPSFSVVLNKTGRIMSVTYKRTLTNVGIARSTYAVKVSNPIGVEVIVQPPSLVFNELGQKRSFNVTFKAAIEASALPSASSFGSLTWVSRKYAVRSPIAVTWQ